MTAAVVAVLALSTASVVVGLVGMIAHRRRDWTGARSAVVDAPPNDVPTGEIPLVRREREPLVGPPVVFGYTLRDWLVHHTHRDGVWEDVVVEFYRRAAAEPRVAAYFDRTDVPRLQRHFLAALMVLTHTGLHRHTIDRMAVAHRGVRSGDGRPITGEAWDLVAVMLVGVLRYHGVPPAAIEPLGALLDPLRAVIVVEP